MIVLVRVLAADVVCNVFSRFPLPMASVPFSFTGGSGGAATVGAAVVVVAFVVTDNVAKASAVDAVTVLEVGNVVVWDTEIERVHPNGLADGAVVGGLQG